jgi:hypothetical protein
VTDRYTKAIEQLGSDKLDVRIGGIYALERIAHDSPRDHPTIMEVLAAFIREHTQEQWSPAPDGVVLATRPDEQAAITVIGRRTARYDSQRVNLRSAYLHAANLHAVNLAHADLAYTNLTSADLTGADLTGADLTGADLTGADLTGADLTGADLTGANLLGADLTSAGLSGANLTSADLTHARLNGAYLIEAHLTGANLTSAGLGGATWPQDTPVPVGWQRDTDSGRLEKAAGDSGDKAAE